MKPPSRIQTIFLFLVGAGFIVLGVRVYPAFIVVGCLFLFVAYRGFTCCLAEKRATKAAEQTIRPSPEGD